MSPRERVRAWVDGELSPDQEATLLAEARQDAELGRLVDEARELDASFKAMRAQEPAPSDDLAERALRAAVRARREQEHTSGWTAIVRSLTRPRWLRLRVTPATTLGLAAAGALAAWVGLQTLGDPDLAATGPSTSGEQHHAVAPSTPAKAGEEPSDDGDAAEPGWGDGRRRVAEDEQAAEAEDGEVPVRFVLPAEEAKRVSVAGDFNGWNPGDTALEDPDGDGVFARTVWLRPGSYAYMFVVDGERWVTDPYASNYRNDGFGNRNAVLRLD